ncbi:hypothetical protein ACFZAU_40665 [Streptomyces sp. NPDC008238]
MHCAGAGRRMADLLGHPAFINPSAARMTMRAERSWLRRLLGPQVPGSP